MKIYTVFSPFTYFNFQSHTFLSFPNFNYLNIVPQPSPSPFFNLRHRAIMDGTRFPSQIANRLGFSSPLCSTCITFITINAPHPACQTFSAQQRQQCRDLPMADNELQWYSSTNTQAYWNSGCKVLLFVYRVKGLMEGLNKLCLCPCT